MVGVMGIIFCLLPETPWWLVQKNRASDAAKVLRKYNGHVEGYDVQETIVRRCFPNHLCAFITLRKFEKYVTEVQMRVEEQKQPEKA